MTKNELRSLCLSWHGEKTQPGSMVSLLTYHRPAPSVIYLLSHILCFYFTSLPLSPNPVPLLSFHLPMIFCSSDKNRSQKVPPQITSLYPQINNWSALAPFFLPSFLLQWMNSFLPMPLTTTPTCALELIASHLTPMWLVFSILFSLLVHLQSTQFHHKQQQSTPFFNPILPSSYHPFFCFSLQQNFLQDSSTLMISTFFSLHLPY